MKFCVWLFVISMVVSCLHAAGWDPEDDTFDPSIKETIANGASRIGDPSPFLQDGYDVVGYTHLQARPDPNSGAMVWVSLMVPFIPEKMKEMGGAGMFLPLEQAETLQELLVKAIAEAGSNDRKEIGVVVDNPSFETWKIFVDGSTDNPVVLYRKRGEKIDQFRFSVNPAKKMLDALNHFLAEGKKLAEAG